MNLLIVTAASGIAGAGLLLILRGLIGATTPLAAVVAELHRPRNQQMKRRSYRVVAIEALAGASTPDREADLAVCEKDLGQWVQDRLSWSLVAATPGLALLVLTAGGVLSFFPPATLIAAIVAGLIGGWFYARTALGSDAETARREFRHALAGYLELVTILMAGGAGVETSMFDAAATGEGTAFRHLRAALTAAQARRQPPWQALGELGQRLRITDLEELEASMTLAGGGAQVRDSLTAKAAGIRMKDLAQQESDAQSRSETMVLPVALMFTGFLLLIGYPALAALSRP